MTIISTVFSILEGFDCMFIHYYNKLYLSMGNLNLNYIYNDNFTLNVLDLTQTELATDEDMRKRIAVFIEKSMTETIILISDGKEFSHE